MRAWYRFLFTLERMSALWPASVVAVKSQLLVAMHNVARSGGDQLVLALDTFRRAAAAKHVMDGLLDDLRPLIKSGTLLGAVHPAVQTSTLALLRELLTDLVHDRAGERPKTVKLLCMYLMLTLGALLATILQASPEAGLSGV